MKKVVAGILVGAGAVYAWNHMSHQSTPADVTSHEDTGTDSSTEQAVEAADEHRFKCDGRVYCSQMTSCEEAMFFLENCPNVKMDGGGDGVPCERQWCGDR